ncbi:hypothetical protein [Nocardia wallacei]|uniref:hypothetical protein n=1 Tax=Nocardia wallacei TaxID=480035 RepID=UPI0024542381|nr:hypothetical protein [Nocardia wallacei]
MSLNRVAAREARGQNEIERAVDDSRRRMDHMTTPHTTGTPPEWPHALRQDLAAAARKLAAAEDETARLYDDIAARYPEDAAEATHIADHARESARRAREVADKFASPPMT